MEQGAKPVWTPGERFVDMDGDGKWDCLDESSMTMDCDQDGHIDAMMP